MRDIVIERETGEVIGSLKPQTEDRKNRDFVMMQREFLENVADLGMKDPIALRILLFIVKQMDYTNALAITMHDIGEILDISRQTVSKHIDYLISEGWISVMKFGRERIYIVNPDVAWTAYAKDRKYCKFQSTVILAGKHDWDVKPATVNKSKRIDLDLLVKLAEQQGI